MTQPICPHVGAIDAADKRCDAAAYPSFENHCFVVHLIDPLDDGLDSREQLLLRDQATYCLGTGHTICPRFRLTQQRAGLTVASTESDNYPTGLSLDGGYAGDTYASDVYGRDEGGPSRWGVWAGLATLVMVFFLCGGSLAAYAGWQMVGKGLVTLSQRAEQTPAGPAAAVLLLATETPTPAPPGANNGVLVTAPAVAPSIATPTATFAFPAAVTATPTEVVQTGPVVITTPTPGIEPNEPLAPELATAVAGALVITQPGDTPPTPTRRPTPIFVVPTSTPAGTVVAGVAVTATPVYAAPTVNFRAANQSILPGACTILLWDVENARAVFLDGAGVAGHGERQVCQRWTSQTYVLDVLRLDGSSETHKVVVELVPNTVTPTITPTNTPVLTPTPTWTPVGTPSATPVPPSYGVRVTVDGGNMRQCTPGARCQINLLIENTGTLADEMFINLGKSGPWSAVICRDDNNCGDTALTVGVGPADRQIIYVAVDVPANAAGESYTFQVEATSGNSGRTITSGQVSFSLRVP
ncbi:MAG: hypothetical protein KF753_07360 [Caldilineaceae bacterium]|nr:hypothetical protein [Caldilineaceae bacterium]